MRLPSFHRLSRSRWLSGIWQSHPRLAPLPTWIVARLSSHNRWSQIWYCLAFSACRGAFPALTTPALLRSLGPPPRPCAMRSQGGLPPLWWALASWDGAHASAEMGQQDVLAWAREHAIDLSGRFVGYDFLIASIRAGNRQAFAWGLAQGLPADGWEEPSAGDFMPGSPILSDLRTPLWHAVDCSILSDPWWIDCLMAAGARWDYAGQGGASAADLDRDRGIGWSAWWKKKTLAQALPSPREVVEPRRM